VSSVKTAKTADTEGAGTHRRVDEPPAFRALTLWFGVIGGIVAWSLHILVAWSFMEVGCLAPGPHSILQRGPDPRGVSAIVAYVATGVPWLVAALALLVCLRLRSRLRSVAEDAPRAERTHLMIVVGLFLNALALAAVTGSGVGILVLRPCG
jgi:hypothetical protein